MAFWGHASCPGTGRPSSKPSLELQETRCVLFPTGTTKGLLDCAPILLDSTQHYPVAGIFLDSPWVENILLMFSILAVVLQTPLKKFHPASRQDYVEPHGVC